MDPSINLPDITDPHTAYAANPTPSNGVNHGHPPYAEMITSGRGRGRPPKRGRGCPPKPMPSTELNSEPSVVLKPLDNAYSSSKRGRGRPPKVKTVSTEIGVAATKRSPGRPPKVNLMSDTFNPDVVRRVSVRPRKPKVISDVAGVAAVKRSRGRPPKPTPTTLTPLTVVPYFSTLRRPRGRPKSLVSSTAKPSSGRPRGRPPKYVNGYVAAGGGVVYLGIQPRRPLKVKKGTGRPVGRPKKGNALQGSKPGETPDSTINYAEVQDKLYRFQSKVKQVVGVLRHHVKNADSVVPDSAMAALKELEDISNMDIMNQQQPNAESEDSPVIQVEECD